MGIPAALSSVPATTPYIQYVSAGGQTVFPYPFEITQDSDLIVVVNGQTLNTDAGYSLSGVGNSTGGNVTFIAGRTAGDIITLYRDITIERITQISQNSGFSSTAFNAEYNNIYLIMQQLQESAGLAIQASITDTVASLTLPPVATRAGGYLLFDAGGNVIIGAAPPGGILPSSFNQLPTNQQFANAGAKIQRFNDRVFIGDAAINDGNFPNVTKDWLSAFQTSTADGDDVLPSGTLLGCQFAVLANSLVGGLGGAAIFGAESLNQTSAGDIIVTNSFAINNNPTFGTSAWAWYGESWRTNNSVGQTVGFEMDVVQQGSLQQCTPYAQAGGEATAFIAAAGAGKYTVVTMAAGTPGVVTWTAHGFSPGQAVAFSSSFFGGSAALPTALVTNTTYYVKTVLSANTFSVSATNGGAAIVFAGNSTATIVGANQFPCTAAFNIGANPVPFDKGIVFSADSISGTNGKDNNLGFAINLAKGHLIQWWAAGGVPTGSITCTGTTFANAGGINFEEGQTVVTQLGLQHTIFKGTTSAVNYLELFHSATLNPVAIAVDGSDTDIDIQLIPKGAGSLKYGTFVASPATSAGYITIKDSAGTVRKLMVGT